MSHATPEKKFMTRMPPRWGFVGVLPVTGAGVSVADLTAFATGNAYVFFQADGADMYIMTADTAGHASQINPGTGGLPGFLGTTGGSLPPLPASIGACALLLTDVEPQPYLLEPGADMYMGVICANANASGYLRWWRASMVSNG